MNLMQRFSAQVEERPDVIALIAHDHGRERTCTFAELDQAAARAATMLHQAGLQPGDAVVLLQPLSIELYVALLGLFRAGLVALTFDPRAGSAHIARCCARVRPRGFIGSPQAQWLLPLTPALRQIPHKWVIGGPPLPGVHAFAHWHRVPPQRTMDPCGPEAPALITITSGATGEAKVAVRSHGLLLTQHTILARSLGLEAGDVELATLPIFVLANLASGLTSILPDIRGRFPEEAPRAPVRAQIARWQPTRCTAAPGFLDWLIRGNLEGNEHSLDSLERMYVGGGPVFPDFLTRLNVAIPGVQPIAVYGSTEAEPMAHWTWDPHAESGRGLIAGEAVPDITLRILRDQWGTPLGEISASTFDELQCAPGIIGEIVVSGPHVLPGYLEGVGDAENKFSVAGARWHRTGDAGWVTPSGTLWLAGRCSAKITDARGVLYPLEIEAPARLISGVRQAAILAWQGERSLLVQLEPGTALRSIADPLQDSLPVAHIARFGRIRTMPLDRRHHSKIDYPRLRHLLASRSHDIQWL